MSSPAQVCDRPSTPRTGCSSFVGCARSYLLKEPVQLPIRGPERVRHNFRGRSGWLTACSGMRVQWRGHRPPTSFASRPTLSVISRFTTRPKQMACNPGQSQEIAPLPTSPLMVWASWLAKAQAVCSLEFGGIANGPAEQAASTWRWPNTPSIAFTDRLMTPSQHLAGPTSRSPGSSQLIGERQWR